MQLSPEDAISSSLRLGMPPISIVPPSPVIQKIPDGQIEHVFLDTNMLHRLMERTIPSLNKYKDNNRRRFYCTPTETFGTGIITVEINKEKTQIYVFYFISTV